jgi:hypothetical protein
MFSGAAELLCTTESDSQGSSRLLLSRGGTIVGLLGRSIHILIPLAWALMKWGSFRFTQFTTMAVDNSLG